MKTATLSVQVYRALTLVTLLEGACGTGFTNTRVKGGRDHRINNFRPKAWSSVALQLSKSFICQVIQLQWGWEGQGRGGAGRVDKCVLSLEKIPPRNIPHPERSLDNSYETQISFTSCMCVPACVNTHTRTSYDGSNTVLTASNC